MGPGAPSGGAQRKRTRDEDEIDEFLEDEYGDEYDGQLPPEELELELGEAGRNWVRKPVEPFDPATTALGARGGGAPHALREEHSTRCARCRMPPQLGHNSPASHST